MGSHVRSGCGGHHRGLHGDCDRGEHATLLQRLEREFWRSKKQPLSARKPVEEGGQAHPHREHREPATHERGRTQSLHHQLRLYQISASLNIQFSNILSLNLNCWFLCWRLLYYDAVIWIGCCWVWWWCRYIFWKYYLAVTQDLNELLATSEMFEDWNSIKQNIMQQNFKSCFWELPMKHIIYKIYFFLSWMELCEWSWNRPVNLKYLHKFWMENKDMFHMSQEMYCCLSGKVHVVVFHILSDDLQTSHLLCPPPPPPIYENI